MSSDRRVFVVFQLMRVRGWWEVGGHGSSTSCHPWGRMSSLLATSMQLHFFEISPSSIIRWKCSVVKWIIYLLFSNFFICCCQQSTSKRIEFEILWILMLDGCEKLIDLCSSFWRGETILIAFNRENWIELPFIDSVTTERSKINEYHNITFTRVLCCQCQRDNPKR